MRRAFLTLLLTTPLAVGGSLLGHQIAYVAAEPDGGQRAQLLAGSGHGYLSHAALLMLAGIAIVAIGGLLIVRRELRGHTTAIGARPFLLVAPAFFVVQEHLERYVQSGAWPVDAALERTFLIGLLLQLPFALLGWTVARLMLRSARRVARALRRPDGVRLLPAPLATTARPQTAAFVPLAAPLARRQAGRAPPFLVAG